MAATARLLSKKINANTALRERALASATFAGILAFGVLAFDYVITGGPDWNPGGAQAYAMEIRRPPIPSLPPLANTETIAPTPSDSALVEFDLSAADEELLGGPYDVYAAYMADAKKTLSGEAGEEHDVEAETPKPGAGSL